MFKIPKTAFPTVCKGDVRTPTDGRAALQVANGVATTRRQLRRSVERRICKGSTRIENTPNAFVTEVDTTTDPH